MRTLRFMGPVARPEAMVAAKALETAQTAAQLLLELGYAADHQRYLQVSAQGRRLSPSDSLPADGEIVLALPMGGG